MSIGFGAFNSSKSPSFGEPTSPFGSSSGVSRSPLFGVSSTPASGAFSYPPTNTPMFGSSSRPTLFDAPSISASPASISPLFGAPCTHASKSPLFGAPNTPAPGVSSSPLFGAPNTPAPGASDSPLFGEYKTTASGTSNSPLFGSASSTPAFGASNSISPLFSASNKLAFGASRSSLFNTFGTPYEVPNKSVFGASSSSNQPGYAACGSCSNTTTPFPLQQSSTDPASKAFGSLFGAFTGKPVTGTPSFDAFTSTTASGFDSSNKPAVRLRISPFGGFQTCSCFGKHLSDGFTSWSPFWKDPVRLASFPLLAPTKSGCQQKEESPAVAYKPLYNYQDENQHIVYMSISAVLAKDNINMSHDELRWIEYSRCNGKGAASNNKSADVFQINSTCNAESDLISIKIEVPSRVAIQLLDAFKSLAIN